MNSRGVLKILHEGSIRSILDDTVLAGDNIFEIVECKKTPFLLGFRLINCDTSKDVSKFHASKMDEEFNLIFI